MKLFEKDHPELFETLQHWDFDKIDEEHRKGNTYFATIIFTIEEKDFGGKYVGNWSANIIGDHEWGIEWDCLTELEKVKQVKTVTVRDEWVPVDVESTNDLVGISKMTLDVLNKSSKKLELV